MPPVRELDPRAEHTRRLSALLQRFRDEERELAASLADLQAEVEHWQRETAIARAVGARNADLLAGQVADLQELCDLTADELAHVRLALQGAAEELAAHQAGVVLADAVA